MDEKELEQLEQTDELDLELDLDLDDIMREFAPEAAQELLSAGEEMPELEQEPEMTGAEDLQQAPAQVAEPTQRFEPLGQQEQDAAAEEDLPEEAPQSPAEEEPQEAFEEGWEPEFEEPMGEYVPPQPIQFRPRSRLQELKRKLIAGPEKRYYEISEMGFIKLQGAIFLSLLVVALSAAATWMQTTGSVPEERLRLMVFVQFFAMLLSALLGSYQLVDGLTDIFKKRFTLNSMLLVTFIACCADGVLGLMEVRISCCAAFSLEVLMALWSAYHQRSTEMGQMDTLRKAVRLDGISKSVDYYEGVSGLLRGEAQVEDFTNTYQETPRPERILGIYGLIALLISIIAGAVAAALHGFSLGVQVLAVSLLAAMPATAFISSSRPIAVMEKRMHALGSVFCGWQGVEGLKGRLVFPLRHRDLFPTGSCKMNGVKFYGDRDPDQVVAYAAALICAVGGGLEPLFTQLLESRNGYHYEVQSLNTYGSGGIGGEVNGEPVVAGNLNFMKEMGVEVPDGMRVDQAVYVAIDGELSGLFAITYSKMRSAATGLATLCGYRKVKTVLTTNDFMITESFIRSKFGVNTRRVCFPEPPVRMQLAAKKTEEGARMYALSTQENLASFAYTVTGARALRTAAYFGMALHLVGGILGLAMMAVLAVLGRGDLLIPMNVLLYELVWMVPGFLVTTWARYV